MIINMQDTDNYGKLEKVIQIEDTAASDIDNSVPASLTVITPDKAKGANFAGSLVYTGDLDGKSISNWSNWVYWTSLYSSTSKSRLFC